MNNFKPKSSFQIQKKLIHEIIVSNSLKDFHSKEITENILLHVLAKKYL